MNKFLERIYSRAPVWGQNMMISAYGYWWKQHRFGGVFAHELKGFKERENYTSEKWQDYQTRQLRLLLQHAYDQVPYYRQVLQARGLTVEKLKKFELRNLPKLPFLKKQTMRLFGQTELLSKKKEKNGTYLSSSGSTGTPVRVFCSSQFHQRVTACIEARVRHWAGVSRYDARAMIGGRTIIPKAFPKAPYYRFNAAEKQVYFSAYHISKRNALNYYQGLQKYPVNYMTGYAMSNYFLARIFDELRFSVYPMKAVLTSSEKLTSAMRAVFQKVYGCKTYDHYSGVEACGLVSECEKGKLHISPDMGILEILNAEGEPCRPGETGWVVCTGLLNFDQPLIRYEMGDLLQLAKVQTCSCGRTMPIVEEIIGRMEDTVIGKDGREMVRFHGIFLDLKTVTEGQVIQHDDDRFQIKVVADGKLSPEDETLIRTRMEKQLGSIKLAIETVPFIPRNANGKFQAVVSRIQKQR